MYGEVIHKEYPILYSDLDTIIENVKKFKNNTPSKLKDIKQIYYYNNHQWEQPSHNDKENDYCYKYYFECEFNGIKMTNSCFL